MQVIVIRTVDGTTRLGVVFAKIIADGSVTQVLAVILSRRQATATRSGRAEKLGALLPLRELSKKTFARIGQTRIFVT